MGILQPPAVLPGQVGIIGAVKYMVTTDNFSTITTAGYMNNIDLAVYPLLSSDVLGITYSYNVNTGSGTFAFFTVNIVNGVITLVGTASPGPGGGVLLPVTAGDVAVFNNTLGQIKDSGAALTNPAETFVVTSPGSLTVNHIAQIADANGSIKDGGVLGTAASKASSSAAATVASVSGATVTGNLLKAADTAGTIADAGAALHAGTTATFAGGGTSNTFTTTNMTASSIVTCVILSSANAVGIAKAVPGTNTLAVTFTADPGAGTTVSWISITPAVA